MPQVRLFTLTGAKRKGVLEASYDRDICRGNYTILLQLKKRK
jgi:hypothetical protein